MVYIGISAGDGKVGKIAPCWLAFVTGRFSNLYFGERFLCYQFFHMRAAGSIVSDAPSNPSPAIMLRELR
jgi:hypothetical protein